MFLIAGGSNSDLLEPKDVSELEWPADHEPYYEARAIDPVLKSFTGILNGHIPVVNGIARVRKQVDLKFCQVRGFQDITSEKKYEELRKRRLKKILVMRNAAFGDTLMIIPALKALRAKYPDAQIHFFGRRDSACLLQRLPFIDHILSCFDTEVASYFGSYDEVFYLLHTIECNPEADVVNALDVTCKVLQVDLPPLEERKPVLLFSQEEVDRARNELGKVGIRPGYQKLAILQPDASAYVRSLTPSQFFQIIAYLASHGFITFVVGQRFTTNQYSSSICYHCGKLAYHYSEQEGQAYSQNASCCESPDIQKKATQLTCVLSTPEFQQLSPRIQFATTLFADLVVSIDSAWSHVAAALDKPAVTIFSNYHPHTRVAYYPKTISVTPDYKKLTCGPCSGLQDRCSLYPRSAPACIELIDMDEVRRAIDTATQSQVPVYQAHVLEPLYTYTSPTSSECPCCLARDSAPFGSKGKHLYLRCLVCGSLFTKEPVEIDPLEYYKQLNDKPFYRPSRSLGLNHHLPNLNTLLQQYKAHIPHTIYDLVRLAEPSLDWRYKHPVLKVLYEHSETDLAAQREPGALYLWLDGLSEYRGTEMLEKVIGALCPGDFLYLTIPNADRCIGGDSAWPPLNTYIAGLNQMLPTTMGVSSLLSRTRNAKQMAMAVSEQVMGVLVRREGDAEDRLKPQDGQREHC